VTISAGVSFYQAGEDELTFVTRADKALYQAKAAGRNCVKVSRPGDE
jgi:diguanylate cyclase